MQPWQLEDSRWGAVHVAPCVQGKKHSAVLCQQQAVAAVLPTARPLDAQLLT